MTQCSYLGVEVFQATMVSPCTNVNSGGSFSPKVHPNAFVIGTVVRAGCGKAGFSFGLQPHIKTAAKIQNGAIFITPLWIALGENCFGCLTSIRRQNT